EPNFKTSYMQFQTRFLAAAVVLVGCANPDSMTKGETEPLTYPETRKVDVKDDYFGTEVADPYRWLEDDNAEDTKAWVTAQNAVTENYLKEIPYRDQI